MKALPTGKILYQTFENMFYLQHEVKHLFVNNPNFSKYTEADEIHRRILKIQLADDDTWEKFIHLL